ncbi:MAG: hypothetical protein U0163_10345 [Gemmatimonadaceae bacterium]
MVIDTSGITVDVVCTWRMQINNPGGVGISDRVDGAARASNRHVPDGDFAVVHGLEPKVARIAWWYDYLCAENRPHNAVARPVAA